MMMKNLLTHYDVSSTDNRQNQPRLCQNIWHTYVQSYCIESLKNNRVTNYDYKYCD